MGHQLSVEVQIIKGRGGRPHACQPCRHMHTKPPCTPSHAHLHAHQVTMHTKPCTSPCTPSHHAHIVIMHTKPPCAPPCSPSHQAHLHAHQATMGTSMHTKPPCAPPCSPRPWAHTAAASMCSTARAGRAQPGHGRGRLPSRPSGCWLRLAARHGGGGAARRRACGAVPGQAEHGGVVGGALRNREEGGRAHRGAMHASVLEGAAMCRARDYRAWLKKKSGAAIESLVWSYGLSQCRPWFRASTH